MPAGWNVILYAMNAERLSQYEIRERLGHGGMASVYRAYDPVLHREVALKILNQELFDDPQVRERFERETKIVARLQHEAIVPVYEVGRENDQVFFVMRYMPGGSLAECLQRRSLTLPQMSKIIQRVAAALDYAHERGVIHRDLKPGNVLFDEHDNAYLSDFDIAKLTPSGSTLPPGNIVGTPTHMSPEQARGEDVDGRSDIYSLGVIMFEMLSGRIPYEARTPLGMTLKHAAYPVPRILSLNPDLPPEIEAVNEKVMAKERDKRYRSGLEFANAFIAALSTPYPADRKILSPSSLPPRSDSQTLILSPSKEAPPRPSLDLG